MGVFGWFGVEWLIQAPIQDDCDAIFHEIQGLGMV